MIIKIEHDSGSSFGGREYTVDLQRQFDGYKANDLIIYGHPFGPVELPLRLELAIKANGRISFRSWEFIGPINHWFHISEICKDVIPSQAQIDTVNGLFSGRILWEGLRLDIGASIQKICPIDVEKEEQLTGKMVYLA